MTTYYYLNDLVRDAMFELPPYKSVFVSQFLHPTSQGSIYTSRITIRVQEDIWRMIEQQDYKYFWELQGFEKILRKLLMQGKLTLYFFNRIISLAVLMPDLCKFINNKKHEVPDLTVSKTFLKHATTGKVPPEYFAYLSVILVFESEMQSSKKIKSERERQRVQAQIEAMKKIYYNAFEILYPVARVSDVDIYLDKDKYRVAADHIYVYNGEPYRVAFVGPDGNARSFIMVADRGCGKTVGLERFVYAGINQGFTVIVFGVDERKEFRFASKKITKGSNRAMWDALKKQKEPAKGLPITIYTDNPKYESIERNIKDFSGDWNALEGVVIFESNIIELLDNFEKWRSEDRTKKIMVAINEAQNIASSVGGKVDWHIFHRVAQFFTNIRGYRCPVILNTQFISKLKKDVRMSDETFASYISEPSERKAIADKCGIKDLKKHLALQYLKEEKIFLHIVKERYEKIRFLVPPCMPETNYRTLQKIMKS